MANDVTNQDQELVEIQETEIQVQPDRSLTSLVETAKLHPRSVQRAINEANSLATLDEDTAASMFYSLPRSGKDIEGPSVRLAEIMAYSFGNIRSEAKIVARDAKFITAEGTCWDLEKVVGVRVTIKRRITNKHGKTFNEDMIGVTSNAAISIALRNAVFKVIPQAFTQQIYLAARRASIGDANTHTQKRNNAIELFGKMGIKEDRLFELIGVEGIQDIGEDQLIKLRGMATALKDGDTTVEQLLNPAGNKTPTTTGATKSENLANKLAAKTAPIPEKTVDVPVEPAQAEAPPVEPVDVTPEATPTPVSTDEPVQTQSEQPDDKSTSEKLVEFYSKDKLVEMAGQELAKTFMDNIKAGDAFIEDRVSNGDLNSGTLADNSKEQLARFIDSLIVRQQVELSL